MPWREASPMDQRTQFIADHLRDVLSITELCALYGISRKTGYKWIERYIRHGPAGLEEDSRRPRRSPNQTSEEVVSAILEARRRHPRWGGKKLLALLHRRHPRWNLPGRSTACDILSRHGMVPIKRHRRRLGHPGKPFATTTLARLSKLSAWWVRLGILPELIEPGHPEQNGRHERMHRTLKAETTRPAAGSLAALQHLSRGVQPRAAARGARPRDPGRVLRAVAAAHAGPLAAARVPRSVRSPLRQCQRRHSMELALGERVDRLHRRVCGPGGDRRRDLERVLWAAAARL